MAPNDRNVKQDRTPAWLAAMCDWASAHPRTVLWLIFVAHLNLLLNILGVFS